MSRTSREFERLADEHRVLIGQYGRVQTRCSQLVKAQAIEIAALSARAMRLQAAVIVRDSALAWAREDRDGYLARLEASLVAADLVICQTGCLSHGAYWRVQDHCRRTGKACVLVEQPDAVRTVHIRELVGASSADDEGPKDGEFRP